ncbi:MAG: type II toxin-antitoxin system Phd/YefM family antitoxin [Acidimicrobiales bacterium]
MLANARERPVVVSVVATTLAAGLQVSQIESVRRGSTAVAPDRLMTIIVVMSETFPLAQVKSRFSEMVDRVEHTHDRIVVTRNGRPAAVMISPDELASLEDTLELLSDPEALAELAEARQAHAVGDYVTGEELRARFTSK